MKEIISRGLDCCSSAKEIRDFVGNVSGVVNRDVFGRVHLHEDDQTGWKVPMTPDGKELGEISMDGSTAKMFMVRISHLIDVCLGEHPLGQDYVADWKECMQSYRDMWDLMSSRRELSFDDVCHFVYISDIFMGRYTALTGRDGMTNYFHMLRDGHIASALETYGNLYRYSQQGWENINSVMKRTFHRGTSKGGGGVGKSKIRPVFLRMIRAAMWRMGHLRGLLESVGFNDFARFKLGERMKLPKFRNIASSEIRNYAMTVLKYGSTDVLDEITDMVDETIEDMFVEGVEVAAA